MPEARERSLTGAETFANAPGTLAAIKSADPTASLQPRAEAARKTSRVDYIVVFSPAGIRWTHPNPQLIGKHVLGSYDQALAGHAQTGTFTTPLGLLRFSRWGRWCEGQSGGGEAAVDQVWPELDPA
ncbi:hypothetical protein [Streptomyces sp. 6-11-2]|uniref:hypothetical protein n=1 Tax=Streptomyces sp. 6-11-2 TaxID=2585753 RepID=UPI0011673638|nr:hypothetical protein [Streptomyces sp. 6-11-2]GED83235.1 hypothetical protein TNCT6_03200 [Streptomyces sp. 6-11-2]